MSADKTLVPLQRWFLGSVTALPDDRLPAGQETSQPIPAPEDWLTASQRQSAAEGLSIYANSYFARLLECLQAEFPAFRHAVGDDAFAAFALSYLRQHPSRGDSLNRLGARFPGFLEATSPPAVGSGEIAMPGWTEFLVDLARLEWCYSEVFDGPGSERLRPLQTDDLLAIPADQWADVRLAWSPDVRLISLQFPVHEFISSVRHGKPAEFPLPAPTWLVVSRREYVVRRLAIDAVQATLFGALGEGLNLGDAIARAFAAHPAEATRLTSELRDWFTTWTRARYFASATVTSRPIARP